MSNQPRRKEYRFKLIVVGNILCGKTSLIRRYVKNSFSKNYGSTVGVDFLLKVLDVGSDVRVNLQLWDIAGQERFGSMTKLYYRDAAACLVVFDLTTRKTFEAVENWKRDVDDKIDPGKPIPFVLLGNKCDLVKEKPELQCASDEDLDNYVQEHGFNTWFRTSAKDGDNVNAAMEYVVKLLLDSIKQADESEAGDAHKSFVIKTVPNSAPAPPPQPSGCCGGGSSSSTSSSSSPAIIPGQGNAGGVADQTD